MEREEGIQWFLPAILHGCGRGVSPVLSHDPSLGSSTLSLYGVALGLVGLLLLSELKTICNFLTKISSLDSLVAGTTSTPFKL